MQAAFCLYYLELRKTCTHSDKGANLGNDANSDKDTNSIQTAYSDKRTNSVIVLIGVTYVDLIEKKILINLKKNCFRFVPSTERWRKSISSWPTKLRARRLSELTPWRRWFKS